MASPRGSRDLSSSTRDQLGPLALKARSPNHWTAREFPPGNFLTRVLLSQSEFAPQSIPLGIEARSFYLYLWKEKAEGWLVCSGFCFYATAQSMFSCRPEPREQCRFLNRRLKKEVVSFYSDNLCCRSRIISFTYSTSVH